MNIAFISDLHVDAGSFGMEAVRLMPDLLAELHPDVFIIAGDVSADSIEIEDVLSRFDPIDCHKLFVPGNHDIWVPNLPGQSSKEKYEQILPEIVQKTGFHYLPSRPVVIRGIGFAGSIGWYDYSFRNKAFDNKISMADYKQKRYRSRIWSDARFAKWGMTDEDVTETLAAQLADDLDNLQDADVPIVAVIHHLPFEEAVIRTGQLIFDFFGAYMGSERFGEVIKVRANVQMVICGHTHTQRDVKIDSIRILVSPLGYEHERPQGVAETLKESLRTVQV
ncbi:MAG TPA: metallophosphoesterase [Armatimonadota bacterium]|nr:metallophosphoesterase [Armatimonadota bacterium]